MTTKPLLECIPNVSEGQDKDIIQEIAKVIDAFTGVKLMHIDAGYAANRTVYTFAGEPEAVVEAAFFLIKRAAELIDMRKHKGIHPRVGATDVCPLVPLTAYPMEHTVILARTLAQRVGEELTIPVYCYEKAAFYDDRQDLAKLRVGGYEALENKLKNSCWKPDYGPALFNPRTGVTIIGARNILVAYNVNLQTNDIDISKKIAAEIRESSKTTSSLRHLKAIGWNVPEYKKVQVSTNIIDYTETPLHLVFETVKKLAKEYGARVTGSELIGMAPRDVFILSGKYYAQMEERSILSDEQLIHLAVDRLGLHDLSCFTPNQRVIELYLTTGSP